MKGRARAPKIAIIGAGGFVFPLVLVRDVLAFPALQHSTFSLHDIDRTRAEQTLEGVDALILRHALPATAAVTTDRSEALAGADFVVCVFQVGGSDAYRADIEIPRNYGIDQTVGDTLGPGGVFRGLRTIAVLRELASDMQRLCPEALLIQYANPMSINCWASDLLGIRTVGLCHSVQHTSRMLAEEIDVPYEEIVFDCAGVNHTAWFTKFEHNGEDLLDRIRDTMIRRHLEGDGKVRSGDLYQGRHERVRTELLRLTGYFHTESSHHASEYWPWFRKSEATTNAYLSERWDYFELSTGHAPAERVAEIVDAELVPSEEYGAYLIDSVVTGTPRVIYANVPNSGAIGNLPQDAQVEVACVVDGNGVRPVYYGDLPPACAALNLVQINVQRLAVHAAIDGDADLVHAAVALDPLTSALLTLPEVRQMTEELLEAEAEWLPQFRVQRSRRTPRPHG